jgi:DNA-binding transcriptional LysR family regulator
VVEALKMMAGVTAALGREAQEASARLAVTVLPSFASRSLAPRLADFHAQHPGITAEAFVAWIRKEMSEG